MTRDVASLLVNLLRDPKLDSDPILYHYVLQPIGSNAIGAPGFLFIQGSRYDVLRTYTVDESRLMSQSDDTSITIPMSGYSDRVMRGRQRQVLDLTAIVRQMLSESESDVLDAKLQVRQVEQFNAQIIRILTTVIGHDLGKDREAWRKWWVEEQGYSYEPPAPCARQDLTLVGTKPTYDDNVHVSFSCFAAGTPVRTLSGLRSIESVQTGDQVLSQDPCTGVLSYEPVVVAVHNKPDRLLKISLDQEVVRATGIHRFWKVGHGWVMARDLKPGDALRALGGVASVKAVDRDGVEPVYNLVVMQAQSYFVGQRGMLVHDNSPVEPVEQPFDAISEPPAMRRE